MKAWYIVVVVLIKGHREIKEPLSSSKVPGTLIGPGGVLRWLKSEGMQFYSVAEWGTQSRWDCTQRAGEKNATRIQIPFLWSSGPSW